MNETYEEELNVTNTTLRDCQLHYANQTASLLDHYPDGFCNVTFDQILCWPPTAINKTATIHCFKELFSIRYDDTRE